MHTVEFLMRNIVVKAVDQEKKKHEKLPQITHFPTEKHNGIRSGIEMGKASRFKTPSTEKLNGIRSGIEMGEAFRLKNTLQYFDSGPLWPRKDLFY